MTFYVDIDEEARVPIMSVLTADEGLPEQEVEALARQVAQAVLREEQCPYETQLSLLFTDNEGIQRFNAEFRGISQPTDVLSFPGLTFEQEGVFQIAEEEKAACFDQESGELLLGDIVISVERVRSQAAEYGHSVRRELAFLIAHSMLHLCGYDHLHQEDAKRMEEKQEKILAGMGITRS